MVDGKYQTLALQARDVLKHYAQIRSVNGSWSCEAFYKRLASDGPLHPGSPGGWFRPLSSDFVADVETLALKHLSPVEYAIFKSVHIKPGVNAYPASKARMNLMYRKLGQVYEEHGLWPVSAYFTPQDLRRSSTRY